jgi:hypothetical protein
MLADNGWWGCDACIPTMGRGNHGERFKSEPWALSYDANSSVRFPLVADRTMLPTKVVLSSYFKLSYG